MLLNTLAASFIWGINTLFLLDAGLTNTEAWMVDALTFTGFKGTLESVFAKGQIAGGVAMLTGSVGGGFIAQATDLGVPYILRAMVLGITFIFAYLLMKDLGFTPKRSHHLVSDMKKIFTTSIHLGLRSPSVRWVMLAASFSTGVSFYAFYAMQPYLLKLYGNDRAYTVAGLAAAIVAGAQIIGGFAVPHIRRVFKRRTSVMLAGVLVSTGLLVLIGYTTSFWVAIILLIMWGLMFAAVMPIRQAYLNGLIPTKQRATVLSFDSLVSSSGGVVIQPALGRVADVWSYSLSYIAGAGFQIMALPFLLLARREHPKSDAIEK